MACEKCAPFGGLWMETPAGMKRCECLPALESPVAHAPVITAMQATVFVEMLASIPYFPPESGARTAIGDELTAICASPEAALWLVRRMRRLYSRWPGPVEMRRVYASRNVPWDGVQPRGISEFYPDGIPSERESGQKLLSGPALKRLPAGQKHEVVENRESAALVRKIAEKAPRMPSGKPVGGRFERELQDIVTAPASRPELPGPTPQIITQADVDKAVEELHKQGKENS